LGLVGLTQVDFGLDKRWVWSLVGLERVVVDRGLSCSDKDGVFWVGSDNFGEAFGGDLEELQKMVDLLVVCCLNGELKIMGLFVSERWPVKWTSKAVDRTVAMRERDREERVLVLRKIC
jgi:hypothetical protein